MKIEKMLAKNGSPILKINDRLVHSSYNPEKEAMTFIEKEYTPHCVHIVFGYGSGYFLEALKNKREHNELIVTIDPLLKDGQITILDHHKNDLIFGDNGLEYLAAVLHKIAQKTSTIKYKIIAIPIYKELYLKQMMSITEFVRNFQNQQRVNNATIVNRAEDWQRNIKLNILNLVRDSSLRKLHQYFDVPIVIAASGPSLMKQIPLLKKNMDKCLIISAGSTTKVLLDHGITPDLIVSIDGAENNLKHFKNYSFEKSRFIYSFQSHYQIRDSFSQQAYYCNAESADSELEDYFERMIPGQIVTLPCGGSVAHLCFSIANYISTGPIALIGQDLAYTNNQSHVSGHAHKKDISEFSDKKEYLYTDGYYGEKVLTSPVLYSMKLSFERIAKEQEIKKEVYNCTEGGVTLKGYEQLSFKEFCDNYLIERKDIITIPDFAPSLVDKDLLTKQFKYERNEINNAIYLCNDAIIQMKLNKSNKQFEQKVLKKLDQIDDKIKKYIKNTGINTIISIINISVENKFYAKENETVKETFERVKNQNMFFYSQMKIVLKEVVEFIDMALLTLKEEYVL